MTTAQGREMQRGARTLAADVVREWELVRRWPGLSAPAKLAWSFLATTRLPAWGEPFQCTPTDVGADQGTSSFAGGRSLKALCDEGLAGESDHERRTGIVWLRLYRPADIARAKPVKWDGQQLLAFVEDDEGSLGGDATGDRGRQVECNPSELPAAAGSGEQTASTQRPVPRVWQPAAAGEGPPAARVAGSAGRPSGAAATAADAQPLPRFVADAQAHAHPQSAPLPSEPSVPQNLFQPSTFGLKGSVSENVHPGEKPRREGATSGSASATRPSRQPIALGDVLAALTAARRGGVIANPDDRQAWIERLVRHTRERVGCPNLRQAPCLDIAAAVVEGRLPEKELAGVLLYIERLRASGRLGNTPASKIFIGFVKRVRGQYCLEA